MLGSLAWPILASKFLKPSLVTPPQGDWRDKQQNEAPLKPTPPAPPMLRPDIQAGESLCGPNMPQPWGGGGREDLATCSELTIRHHHEDSLCAKASAPAAVLWEIKMPADGMCQALGQTLNPDGFI